MAFYYHTIFINLLLLLYAINYSQVQMLMWQTATAFEYLTLVSRKGTEGHAGADRREGGTGEGKGGRGRWSGGGADEGE